MSAFLVDTNVLVYAYDPTDEIKRARAIDIVERLSQAQLGVLSPQVLGEFFVTVTRRIPMPLTTAEAERSVTNYARSWVVRDLTSAVVLEAIRGAQRYSFSYWDALIWAVAKGNQVPYILSEDFSDGILIEGVRFLNPFAETFDLGILARRR